MSTVVKSDLEQQIEDLGVWAAGLELSAADPQTPYWLRAKDAEHAKTIREEQLRLLDKLAVERQPLPRCAVEGCNNVSIGSPYCARCEEEINGNPYPFARVLEDWRAGWDKVGERVLAVAVVVVVVVLAVMILK